MKNPDFIDAAPLPAPPWALAPTWSAPETSPDGDVVHGRARAADSDVSALLVLLRREGQLSWSVWDLNDEMADFGIMPEGASVDDAKVAAEAAYKTLFEAPAARFPPAAP